MPIALLDFLSKIGESYDLFSVYASVRIGKSIQSIYGMYCINDMQSEPHQHHQNHAECRMEHVKKASNLILDHTGSPVSFWLLSRLHTV
jgi:hypothetical protein